MKKKPSKVSIALAYLTANPGATRYSAAKHADIKPSQVYDRLKKDKAKLQGVCPACGQPL